MSGNTGILPETLREVYPERSEGLRACPEQSEGVTSKQSPQSHVHYVERDCLDFGGGRDKGSLRTAH